MTKLTELFLSHNSLSDIHPLAGLTQLTRLGLSGNPILDTSPIYPLTQNGLTDVDIEVSSEPSVVRDPHLAAAIRAALDLPAAAPLSLEAMQLLTELTARELEINDLTGLQHATNLKRLFLSGNSLSDVRPIANLTNLTTLSLSSNSLSDIHPLANLTNLKRLFLSGNTISDVSRLAGLTQLTTLSLSSNSLSDVSPLEGLTQLTALYLSKNSLSDVSPIANLTQLTRLSLSKNSIRDVSALSNLTQLTNVRAFRQSDTRYVPDLSAHPEQTYGCGYRSVFGAAFGARSRFSRRDPKVLILILSPSRTCSSTSPMQHAHRELTRHVDTEVSLVPTNTPQQL